MKTNRLFRKIVLYLLVAIAVIIVLFFSFRNNLLTWTINKVADEIRQKTGATLSIESASFSGITGVSMKNISVVPALGDTLLFADTVHTGISFWRIFTGTIQIKELYSSGVSITISCRDSSCNYNVFLHEKKVSTATVERNYSLLFKRLLDRVFNFAPQKASLNNITFTYRNESIERKIIINEYSSDENSISGIAEDLQTHAVWKCNGSFSQSNRTLQLNVFPSEQLKAIVPLVSDLLGIAISFDTIHIGFDGYNFSRDLLTGTGHLAMTNFSVFHKKISSDTIKIPSASFDFLCRSGKTFLEIDSNSVTSLGDIRFNPFIRYSNDGRKEYAINIKTERIKANSFFSSLPQGMFDEVRDLTADGTLKFDLNFRINTAEPDSLIFESSLKKDKFRLKKYGAIELNKLNGDFIYSVYEGDRYIRSFMVGPSNLSYTSLDSISPSFRNAVLTSEDGNFFYHNGFNEDAFRKSIITNFKAGKFVRGGSTISMQLVKNVFLNRKKTIARKAEEALLVWLIESNRLSSKERMLEVYMNIIELGPGVYGIGEASDFYFKKKPIQLTLPEGIFLASLLPHPKWFKYSFDTLGNLKPYLADYYRVVSDFMLKKNLITQEEHDGLLPHVVLTGPAREMVVPSDTIPVDEEL